MAIEAERNKEEVGTLDTILNLEAYLHVIVNLSLRVEVMKNPKVKNNKAKDVDPNQDLLVVKTKNQEAEARLANDNSQNQ